MELIKSLLSLLCAGLAGFAGHIVAHDFCERSPTFARSLIRGAISLLPTNDRQRYSEEWLAHLNDCEGVISKFKHAFGCLACAYSMRRISIATTASGPKTFQIEIEGFGSTEIGFSAGKHVFGTYVVLCHRQKSAGGNMEPITESEILECNRMLTNLFGPLGDTERQHMLQAGNFLMAATDQKKSIKMRFLVDGRPIKIDDIFPHVSS
jgi:hypothetical protein